MIFHALTATAAEMAVLHVTIHRDAGTIHDVAADGAVGQCSVAGVARLACPADALVTFRWVDPKADNARLRKVLGLPDRLSPPPGASETE